MNKNKIKFVFIISAMLLLQGCGNMQTAINKSVITKVEKNRQDAVIIDTKVSMGKIRMRINDKSGHVFYDGEVKNNDSYIITDQYSKELYITEYWDSASGSISIETIKQGELHPRSNHCYLKKR